MNPYQQHMPMNAPPYPGAYISAPPMGAPPPGQMMPPPHGYPPYLPPPPPQGVPVARYAAPFVPIMPQMNQMIPPQAPVNTSAPPSSSPLLPLPTPTPIPRKPEETTITVYVGKIPTAVEDDFMRKILEACGEVVLWRRVTDPSTGLPKTFAFCDFKNPEGVLRALRLLNGLALDANNLLLKVDEKNQKLLDAYTTKRNAEQHGTTPKPGQAIAQTPAALSKEKEEDDAVRAKVKELVEKQEALLSDRRAGKGGRDDEHTNGDDKSRLVSREIKNFRERQAQKDAEKKDKKDDEEERKERDLRERETDRQKEKDRLRLLRDRERERDSRRKQREEKDFRDKERDWEQRERKREVDREDDKRRERRDKELRAQEIIDQENDDDEYAKKKIRSREARKRRQREREDDDMDRQREREDLEVRRREEEERRKQEELKQQEAARIAAEELKAQNEKKRMDELQQQRARMQQQKRGVPDTYDQSVASPNNNDDSAVRIGFAKRAKLAPVAGFTAEAEEENVVVKKKRTFVPLAYPEDGKPRKEDAQSVIDRIPTGKDELFAVEIDWPLIDKHKIVEKKMKPWVTKKIVEFLGEEEKTLIDFIMNKIMAHTQPRELLTQLVPILDEEADIFVVKLWRMLVYEMFTAAKS